MSEERAKVLKMLKEGRITVEEAELLLDALREGPEGTGQGRGPRERQTAEEPPRSRFECGDRNWWGGWDWSGKRRPGGHQTSPGWFDFDFSQFQTGFKDAFKGVEESIREMMKNFPNMSYEGHLGRMFGKESAQLTKKATVSGSDVRSLQLSNTWGDVEIIGSDGSEISVVAHILAWGPDQATAKEIASEIEINHYREGEALVIKHRAPESRSRYKVDFEITVPRALSVELKGMSGNLSVAQTAGAARLLSLSGDIRVKGVTGDVSADSKSGEVELEGCRGNVQAATASGDLLILDHHGRSLAARSMSGDLSAEVTLEGAGEVTLKSMSGDIRLKLPATSAVQLSAETTSGEVDCSLPLDFSERGNHRVRGVLNSAEGKVELVTKSGSIAIRSL